MAISHDGFHAADGWYFQRGDDGSVTIHAAVSRCNESVTLTAEAWASVIASVGAGGESSDSYHSALNTHKGATS